MCVCFVVGLSVPVRISTIIKETIITIPIIIIIIIVIVITINNQSIIRRT